MNPAVVIFSESAAIVVPFCKILSHIVALLARFDNWEAVMGVAGLPPDHTGGA